MHLHTNIDYVAQRYQLLWLLEGQVLWAYADTKGIATIGIGLNLRDHGELVLKALGFDLGGSVLIGAALQKEQEYAGQILREIRTTLFPKTLDPLNDSNNAVMQALNPILQARAQDGLLLTYDPANFASYDAYIHYKAGLDSSFLNGFQLPSTTVSADIFRQALDGYTVPGVDGAPLPARDGYEKTLDNWLTATGLKEKEPGLMERTSKERLVLLSLAFNGKNATKDSSKTSWDERQYPSTLGTKLPLALYNGDRAEAWYEIRYNINLEKSQAIARRRYIESEFFGLYDEGITGINDIDEASAKGVFRMYTRHRDDIKKYDSDYAEGFGKAVSAGSTIGVSVLSREASFQVAFDKLVFDYIFQKDIPIQIASQDNIFVGEEATTIYYRNTDADSALRSLTGTADSDLILAESGNDTVFGGGGADVIYGGSGADFISGGKGDDYLDGGAGEDTYYYFFGDGHDTIRDPDTISNLNSPNQGRIIYVDADGVRHIVTGGRKSSEDPSVYLGLESDRIQYRAEANGDMTLILDGVAAITVKDANGPTFGSFEVLGMTFSDNAGNDLSPNIQHGEYREVVVGDTKPSSPNDDLHPYEGTRQIYGLSGNDYIDGGTVTGIELYGGEGSDGLQGAEWYVGLYYSDPAYFISWLGEIKPGLGAFLYGEAGNDVLSGGLRDDAIEGGTGHDDGHGWLGNDRLRGGLDNDTLNGDEGYDVLDGEEGNDWVLGGADADLLKGGAGDDALYGDSSDYVFTWGGDFASSTLLSGTIPAGDNTFAVIQDVAETEAGDDTLLAGDGNDKLFGGAGDDLLYGEAGADELQGEGGDDFLFGGADDDMLFGDSASDAVANDTQIIPGDYGLYTYIWRERHTGLEGDDYLDGGAGDDQMWGEGGNDQLLGGIGNDRLYGGRYDASASGNDYLDGGAGNDLLFGEDGHDTLTGGTGTDQLQGGLGDDTYFFNLDDGQDVIFDDGGLDMLVFGEGIAGEQIVLAAVGGNLVATVNGTGDSVVLADWFASADARVETIAFHDGTVWGTDTVMAATATYTVEPSPAATVDLTDSTGPATIVVGSAWESGSTASVNDISVVDRDGQVVIGCSYREEYGSDPIGVQLLIDYGNGLGGNFSVVFPTLVLVSETYAITHPGTYLQDYRVAWSLYFDITNQSTYSFTNVFNVVYTGTSGNDVLEPIQTGNLGYDSHYYGLGGDDVMYGSDGLEYFHGGVGNDTMYGGGGGAVYDIDPAEQDVVIGGGSRLRLPQNAVLADLTFVRDGSDLLVGATRVKRYFEPGAVSSTDGQKYPYLIERLEGNGWEIDLPRQLISIGLFGTITGSADSDALAGDIYDNTIYGLEGG